MVEYDKLVNIRNIKLSQSNIHFATHKPKNLLIPEKESICEKLWKKPEKKKWKPFGLMTVA